MSPRPPALPPSPSSDAPLLRVLTTPWGFAVVISFFILLSGGVSVGIGQILLRRSLDQQVRQITTAYGYAVAHSTATIFNQAEPVIQSLAAISRSEKDDQDTFAHELHALAIARRGLSALGWVAADGSYHGIRSSSGHWLYVEQQADGDGHLAYRESLLDAAGNLARRSPTTTPATDVRNNSWYRASVAHHGATWSARALLPTPSEQAISCSEAIATNGQISGVAIVSFSLPNLSQTLDPLSDGPLIDNILLTEDGTILAMPHDWVSDGQTTSAAPDLPAFTNALPDLSTIGPNGSELTFKAHGELRHVTILPCQVRSGPRLLLAQVISQNVLEGEVHAALTQTLGWASVAMLSGVLVSWWFAAGLGRAQRRARSERQRADAAEAQVEQLGAYRLLRQIGVGGMGEVWLAEHHFLARRAAIKRIRLHDAANLKPEERELLVRRFHNEARVTANLRSRHTVELYDYGVATDGSFFYVMELLDGISLHRLVERHGPQPIGRVINFLIQICGSLGEAHSFGLVHRDIKPENLFLSRRASEVDLIKVIDFGLVHSFRSSFDTVDDNGLIIGTPTTIAPEQTFGHEVDGRADLYAVGCVAFYLLTGRHVFELENPSELIDAHRLARPLMPSCYRPNIPEALDRLVLRCLAKSPLDRPHDAAELATELAALAIPPAEVWTNEDSCAWWAQHLPQTTDRDSTLVPLESPQLLVIEHSNAHGRQLDLRSRTETLCPTSVASGEQSDSRTEAIALVQRIRGALNRRRSPPS